MNLNNICKKKKKMKEIISNKKRRSSSSSFCMCFHSVVLENGLVIGEKGEPPSEEEKVKPVLSPATNMMMSSYDKDGSIGRENKLGRRSFSRFVKAVFFETSLMKKMRNKKLGQKLYQNYINLKHSKPKPKPKSKSKPTKNFPSKCSSKDNHSTKSTSSSTFSSSCLCTNSATNSSSPLTTTTSRCSSSSLSWNSKPWLSENMENNYYVKGKVGKGNGSKGCCNGFNLGICLFLISLLVLIIWGKICAIFCTSTCLFFAYPWSCSIKLAPSENIAVDHHFHENIDKQLYKKKVIMEGLLERNHSRNRLQALLKF